MILSTRELNAGLNAGGIVIDPDLEGKNTARLGSRGSKRFGPAGLEASRLVNDVDGDGLCK